VLYIFPTHLLRTWNADNTHKAYLKRVYYHKNRLFIFKTSVLLSSGHISWLLYAASKKAFSMT